MSQIFASLAVLTIFTLIAAWAGHKEPANLPFSIFFAATLIVLAIWGAVRELKARS